jgi:hypothetical protein
VLYYLNHSNNLQKIVVLQLKENKEEKEEEK